MSFLHPTLLFGALLFAVPLIIHLLNRQRYKRRQWAAMEFLLRAYKKNRRRVRTENLLLLLLRCLIPVILALAIARPLLESGPSLGLGGAGHHVLVLDQSYSMGLQPEGDSSPFQRMKSDAGQLLERIEKRSGEQKITVVLAGIRTTMPVRLDLNVENAKAEIARLGMPQDSAVDLTDALSQTADLIEDSEAAETRVYLFTDMQQRAFGDDPFGDRDDPARPSRDEPDAEMFRDTARDAIARIVEKADLSALDVGAEARDNTPTQADNVQVVDLRIGKPMAIARDPVSVIARLHNRSATARDVQVTLEKDGGEPTRKSTRLEAGAEGEVEFEITFLTTGPHHLHVLADGDGLDADNSRYLVVHVRDRLRVLMVEGSAETDPALMETEHMRSILDPTGGEGSADLTIFAPKVISFVEFLSGREDFGKYDVVVLANVERLDGVLANALHDAVRAGTGLFVMFGDATDPANLNAHLHDAGQGPMPFALIDRHLFRPGGEQFYGSRIDHPDHPVLGGFESEAHRDLVQNARVFGYFASDERGLDERVASRVLVRVRDPELSPLLVASSFGEGKALFLTTPINRRPQRWNDWGMLAIALPLLHESVLWLALPTRDPFNVLTGAELGAAVRYRPRDVKVVLPERAGGAKVLVSDERARQLEDGQRYALPPFRQTEYAGIYVVETAEEPDVEGSGQPLYFAVNPDPDEGDLRYLAHDVARERLGIPRILRDLPSEASGDLPTGRSDFGLPLLWLLLMFVVGEATLARMVTRRRSG